MRAKILTIFVLVCAFMTTMSAQNYRVEPNGIGPVKIEANYKTLPESVAGLYDSRTLLEEYDELEDMYVYTVYFKLNGEDMLYAKAYESGEIFEVRANSKSLCTKSGVYQNMPVSEFLKVPGVSVQVYPEVFAIIFQIDGVDVGIDFNYYSDAGQKKFDKAMNTGVAPKFVASDFNSDAVIFLGGFNIWY